MRVLRGALPGPLDVVGAPVEGQPLHQQLVEDDAHAVDIGGPGQVLAGGLLGGGVSGRPDDDAHAPELPVLVELLGYAEVGDIRVRRVLGVEEDVRRL